MALRNKWMEQAGSDGAPAGGSAAPAAPANTGAGGATITSQTESATLSEQQIDDLLSYNPFKKSEEVAPAPEAKPAEASAPVPTDPAKPVEPKVAVSSDPEKDLMKKQLEEAQAVIKRLAEAKPAEAQPAAPAAPADEIPPYNFTIPQELMKFLDSENPAERQQGIGVLMQGTARAVHQTIMKQVSVERAQMMETIPQVVQQIVSGIEKQREIFNDFYGSYKDLNVPELYPMIVSTAQRIREELGGNVAWSPSFKQALALRVYGALGKQIPGAAAPVAPAAPFTPSGSPARAGNVNQSGTDFMAQVGFI